MEACLGAKKNISYHILEDCTNCSGTGVRKGGKMQTCGDCHGSGHKVRSKSGMIFYSECENCGGLGQTNPNPCSVCNGTGSAQVKKSIEINIPAGVVDDQMLVVAGAGNRMQSKLGDLYVSFQVHADLSGLHLIFLDREKQCIRAQKA